MSLTYNAKILLKTGQGDPGTTLYNGEPGFDSSNNLLYIGKGLGSSAIPVMPADVNKAYVDASFALKTEIPVVDVTKAYVDGSIYALNASIGLAGFIKADSLYPYATNASVGLALDQKQNIGDYIKSASTGSSLKWVAGVLDVSIIDQVGASVAYVDASLQVRDAYMFEVSTYAHNIPIADVTKAYVDGSLAARDASLELLFALDTSTWYTFNTLQNPIEDYGGELRAGIKILTADVPLELSFDNDGYAKIGKPGTYFETVAVRDSAFDSALDNYFAKWNQPNQRFDGFDLFTYVDTSFGYRDTSISDIWTKIGYIDTSLNNIPVGGDVTKAYVDASLGERDTSINWLNDNKVNGTTRITVSATEPVGPVVGDLWVDLN